MGRKRRRKIRIIKRHGWKRAKRRTVARRRPSPPPVVDIPEATVSGPNGLLGSAPVHCQDLPNLLVLAAKQATTDGLMLAAGVVGQTPLCFLGSHIDGWIIYSVGTPATSSPCDNIIILSGDVAAALNKLQQKRGEHVSFLYLEGYAKETLAKLTERLVAGTIVVLWAHMLMDFCDWASDNDREMYALSRLQDRVVVVMLAN